MQVEGREETDVMDAAKSLGEWISQLVYGLMAFAITVGVLQHFYGYDMRDAAEPGMLNAGIAYYTHAATGRIIRAMVVLIRASPKVRRR